MRNCCELLLLLLLLLLMLLWLLEGRDNELLSVVAAAAMAAGREDEELMLVVAGFALGDAAFDAGRRYGIATNCYWCCCSHNCRSCIRFTVDLTDAVLRQQYIVNHVPLNEVTVQVVAGLHRARADHYKPIYYRVVLKIKYYRRPPAILIKLQW